jgi:hypothetical protein
MGHSFKEIAFSIEAVVDKKTMAVAAREGEQIEFKESFNWANRSAYAKSMAAFANNSGGYVIFGVTNEPRQLVGLRSRNFEDQDDAKMAEFMNALFSPAIQFERTVVEIAGVRVGLLWTARHDQPPVMAIKSADEVREAEIYYRYNARSEKVKFPEMRSILDGVRERERLSWSQILSRIAKMTPDDLGIMDVAKGEIYGRRENLLIDAELIPKLKFIKEGSFEERGQPTLKLVGDVTPIDTIPKPHLVRITDDPSAPAMRPEAVFDAFPLNYAAVVREASQRYSDFKANGAFHKLMRALKKNPKYCHTRYLYPAAKSAPANLYSREIFDELDRRYTRSE